MKIMSAIARYLASLIFLVIGLNGFLHFIPFPPPNGVAGQFMGALFASHYLTLIFGLQVIAAVLLLANRFVPLALAILAPVIVNILAFDGAEWAAARPLRCGPVGLHLRRCAKGLCASAPTPIASSDLNRTYATL